MRINWKDIAIRALKTFLQAFISAFSIDSLIGISDTRAMKRALLAVLISAVAAGISALWNLCLEWASNKIDSLELAEAEYHPEHGKEADNGNKSKP